ncbi:DNA polymerase III subunit delta [Nitrosovibrio sp. Nv4]|uniref:DNA polymerase III subunit delta n=1 Tax=Nitrosovibrio sp. Nv4 TaxID=1945880 RepID=UPI000BDD1BBD|nr:DNA polymerase III subunit delta [Nitrosovibrio sp. Nv4]SOD40712.1 DNA polymerase III, delta subunit [Nitrosovibrio sp. Nv4]
MRITPDHLSRHLQKQPAPLYTVFGDELLLSMEAADLIRASAREAGYIEREIFTVDHHFNWAELQQRGTSLSLFGERRIMDIRIPSGKPGNQGSAVLETYCRSLPPDTVTLVTLPKIDRQGSGAKWFKALEEAGVMVQVYPVERARLPPWIGQRLGMQGQNTDPDTLQFLADKVEGNLIAAYQELKKLGLLYPPGMLSFTQVKDAVLDVARYDVFKLSGAMMAGETVRYSRILEGLRGEGTALPLIVNTLAGQIRSLATIRKGLNSGRPVAQLMNQVRAWGDQQKAMENAARRLSLEQLVSALSRAAKIDRISKGIGKGDAWDELLQLGLRFAITKR